ncbi:hypothetical protein C8R47DRAFT_1131894 [Mycena vitilis]|nr:hypothetical protein C8R47DRAFT_1131894 [Mycena vitilis]
MRYVPVSLCWLTFSIASGEGWAPHPEFPRRRASQRYQHGRAFGDCGVSGTGLPAEPLWRPGVDRDQGRCSRAKCSFKSSRGRAKFGLPRSARRRRQNPLGNRLGLGKDARAGCVPGRILRQFVHARRVGAAALGSRLKGSGIFCCSDFLWL